MSNRQSTIINEIDNWKLEAKLEDNNRYFYHTEAINKIEDGSRCYIIGRKGTGKTAISEYLDKKKDPKRFSQKLTFKSFPFKDLYKHTNDSFTSPNQYITFWKYTIYSTIAKQMIVNENIDSQIREKLVNVYGEKKIRSLARTISQWTSASFNFKILGQGLTLKGGKSENPNEISWIDKVEILEDLILEHIDDSKYLIIFDELDEDYKDIIAVEQFKQYTSLLTSLFKAVQDIKSIFPKDEFDIVPVIFLRNDIYDVLRDPDKTKWSDLILEIEWNEQNIKKLLAFRISRALNKNGQILSFSKAWNFIFHAGDVGYGTRQLKKMSIFDYITRSTHIRPRDYVRFLQVCASKAPHGKSQKISAKIVVRAETTFSSYFRSELEDEIHAVLPDISEIFNIITEIRKQTFSFDEFKRVFTDKLEKGILVSKDVEFALKILFNFSVIGNQLPQKNAQVFRYSHREAWFSSKDSIVVHRGLFKALQII